MAANEISIEKIFLILRIRLWWVVGIFVGAIAIAGLLTLQMPKMYVATASLNFDFSGNNPMDGRGRSILAEESYLTTQVGILQSLNVGQKVVDSLSEYERGRLIAALDASNSVLDTISSRSKRFLKGLFSADQADGDEDGKVFGDAGDGFSDESLSVSSPYDWLAKALGADLLVTPLIDSRIVEVSYYSTDPEIAALVADRFAQSYIDANLRMVIDPARKTKVWFDEQLKLLRTNLETAQARLTAYQQQEGIVSSDQRIDIESTHLRALADQLAETQQAKRIAETEQNKLREVLDRGASLMTFGPVFDNPVVQKIKADIRVLESELVEGSNSLGNNHPRIKRLKSEFEAANGRLNKEIDAIVDGINNAVELSRERAFALEEAMEKQKQLVLKLKNEHDKILVLERDVESAQAVYNAALNQMNTTSMQSMVDQTNVSVIDHASVPSRHALPRVTKNLALGAFGGLLLGVGFALFMEVFRRKVHSGDDIVGDLGVPLLGQLSKY